jgi:glycosyltransferase involved in cell wall biosynthesis
MRSDRRTRRRSRGDRATVLHVVDGLNIGFELLAPRYDRSRFRPLVATLGPRTDDHARLTELGIPAVTVDADSRRDYPAAVLRLAKLLRGEGVDIVQTHGLEPSAVGLAAATAARTPARVLTRHHSDITTLMNKSFHRWVDRRQALWADRVVAVSEGIKQAMVAYEGVPADHISVVQYGYDFDVLRPVLGSDERARLRGEMGGDDRILVVTVGRMDWPKGHAYLLEAAPHVLAAQPDVVFVFVGDGPSRSDLEADVRRRGLTERVTFLGFRSDAWRLMEAGDLVVQATLTEGFSSVVMEAQALERPIVMTDVAGAREQVGDDTGVIVPPRDADAIAGAVVSLAADPARRRALGEAGRRRVVERFNVDRWVARTEAVYDDVLRR